MNAPGEVASNEFDNIVRMERALERADHQFLRS